MPNCEICGKAGPLTPCEIEKVEVEACAACAHFGKARAVAKVQAFEQKAQTAARSVRARAEEPIPQIVENYAERIHKRRESLGLKQIELAKKVAERESVISSLENGTMEPSVELAQKLERILSIRLIEKTDAVAQGVPIHHEAAGGALTIGDLLKMKKR